MSTVTNGVAVAILFLKSDWPKVSSFFLKKWLFLAQTVFISGLYAQIWDQRTKIETMNKISAQWTRNKRIRISTWNKTEHLFMAEYTRDSDDVIKLLMLLNDFVPGCHHAAFGGNWAANKGETDREFWRLFNSPSFLLT